MRRFIASIGLISSLAGFAGCSGGDSEAPNAKAAAGQSQAKHPAADSAHAFLSAVVKGDAESATRCLTPRAVEQFEAQGKRFAFPGLDNATFQMGAVRERSSSDAVVQCIFTAKTPDGSPASEEICCLMRKVGKDWLVSGIAYDTGNNQPPVIVDFETFRPEPQPTPGGISHPAIPQH